MSMRVQYDLESLRNGSITLDLQINPRTLRVVFSEQHAY